MKSQTSAWFCAALMLFVLKLGVPAAVCGQEIKECLACHEDRALVKVDSAGKVHSLFVDRDAFMKSVHGKAGHTCVDCHEGVEATRHPAGGIEDVSCSKCHSDIEQEYLKSKHGQLIQTSNPYAPKCQDCHTAHGVLLSTDPQSSVHPDNLSRTCKPCHEEEAKQPLFALALDFARGKIGAEEFSWTAFFAPLVTRVNGHGKVNMSCDYSTQRCSDCHFDVVRHGDTERKPKVCSTCHEYGKSSIVFGTIHRAGVITSPLLGMLLVFAYLVAIAGVVFYFKKPKRVVGEKTGETSAQE